MRRFRKTIRQKLTDLWEKESWILRHDDLPAHTSMLVREFRDKNKTVFMPKGSEKNAGTIVQGPPNTSFFENALKKTTKYFLKFLFLFERKILHLNGCLN